MTRTITALLFCALLGVAPAGDPYLWLEDVHGTQAMAWVNAENAKTLAVLKNDPNFAVLYADALKIAEAKDRIPTPEFIAGSIYNFWQDDEHVRGIWRRTTSADFASASPEWTTVLDLDAVSKVRERQLGVEGRRLRVAARESLHRLPLRRR